jgi:hypothetical protein
MTDSHQVNVNYASKQLRRSRHPFRRAIKRFYFEAVLRDVTGSTIDLGSGAGQLLRRVPLGSIGLKVNPVLVEALKKDGLEVTQYDVADDVSGLARLAPGQFRSLVVSHVLKHFADAAVVISALLRSGERLGIERVVVQGRRGYHSGASHNMLIDLAYIDRNRLRRRGAYRLAKSRYFPTNTDRIGRYAVFHKLILLFSTQ